ncbi:MAG: hypothetical protein M1596_06400 [Firmicutes bacterium]|nr:hypothetical protein [Bacillota bacterium]
MPGPSLRTFAILRHQWKITQSGSLLNAFFTSSNVKCGYQVFEKNPLRLVLFPVIFHFGAL